MSTLQTDVPLINVPLVNPDGRLNQIWFQFFVQLWRRTGSGTGGDGQLTIADVLSYELTIPPLLPDVLEMSMGLEMVAAAPPSLPAVFASEMEIATIPTPTDPLALEMGMAQISDSMGTQAAQSVTLGASPATYTATYRQALHITGGTVSAISLARSGTPLALAATTNLIELSPGDQVTVTYTALPTTTVLGR